MFMFQVGYDEVAVLTTFDRAEAPQRSAEGQIVAPGSLRTQPGLYFRLPWPIQKVYVYDKRLRLHESRLEQIQTEDNKSVVVSAYLAWRIGRSAGVLCQASRRRFCGQYVVPAARR